MSPSIEPEPVESQPEIESAERLRAVIGKLSRRLRPTVAGSGLTPSQIAVLFAVVRSGPIGLSELAALESLNPTMLSRITGALCEQGLIRRAADPQDRRAGLVQATAAGRRLRRRIHGERALTLADNVGQLTEREQRALWNALGALEALAEQIGQRRQ